jgi:calcineurin-like phosphoesterase family protein
MTSNIWFTSDPHFFHANVIKYCDRPYASVEEMNEALIANWNSVVKPEDTIYCLGDFSLAYRPVELFTRRLNGIKVLIPGNHDFCHSYNKKSRNPENRSKWISKYEDEGWAVLPEHVSMEIAGTIVNLAHMPYSSVDDVRENELTETRTDKYEKYRPKDDGHWLLCGHVHEKWRFRKKMINVGVDVWNYTPVNMDVIADIITRNFKE